LYRRRALVIERSGDRVTALTADGEFVTWRDRRDLMPGEEVWVPTPRFQGFLWRKLVPAAILASILIVSSIFGYRHYLYARPVLAYVTFDSSGDTAASIELEVNDRGLVRKAVALDEAGAAALSAVRVEMKAISAVLSSLRDAVPGVKQVIIAIIPVPEGTRGDRDVSAEVSAIAHEIFGSVGEATALVLDMETRAMAQELGVSAGRAALWALWNLEWESYEEPWMEPGADPGIYVAGGTTSGQAEPGGSTPLAEPLHLEAQVDELPGSSPAGEGETAGPSGAPSPGANEVNPRSTGEEKGASGKATPHAAQGAPPTTPGKGSPVPPGLQKKADVQTFLDMIRSGLPEINWGDPKLGTKKSQKELENLAKDLLKALLEASKSTGDQNDMEKRDDRDRRDDHVEKDNKKESEKGPNKKEDDKKGNTQSGLTPTGSGSPSTPKGGKQDPGKSPDKPVKPHEDDRGDKGDKKDKDEKPGKDSKGKDDKPGARDPKDSKGKDEKQPGPKGADPKAGGSNSGQPGKGQKGPLSWTSDFLRRLWR